MHRSASHDSDGTCRAAFMFLVREARHHVALTPQSPRPGMGINSQDGSLQQHARRVPTCANRRVGKLVPYAAARSGCRIVELGNHRDLLHRRRFLRRLFPLECGHHRCEQILAAITIICRSDCQLIHALAVLRDYERQLVRTLQRAVERTNLVHQHHERWRGFGIAGDRQYSRPEDRERSRKGIRMWLYARVAQHPGGNRAQCFSAREPVAGELRYFVGRAHTAAPVMSR